MTEEYCILENIPSRSLILKICLDPSVKEIIAAKRNNCKLQLGVLRSIKIKNIPLNTNAGFERLSFYVSVEHLYV